MQPHEIWGRQTSAAICKLSYGARLDEFVELLLDLVVSSAAVESDEAALSRLLLCFAEVADDDEEDVELGLDDELCLDDEGCLDEELCLVEEGCLPDADDDACLERDSSSANARLTTSLCEDGCGEGTALRQSRHNG